MNASNIVVKNINDQLKSQKKSREWLAEQTGLSLSMIGHMLSGNRNIIPKRMIQIAQVLGVSSKDLMKDPEKEERFTVKLRGETSNRRSKTEMNSLLFVIEDSIDLKRG